MRSLASFLESGRDRGAREDRREGSEGCVGMTALSEQEGQVMREVALR